MTAASKGTTRQYVYDDDGQLVGEYDGAGGLPKEIIWMHDVPIAALKPKAGFTGGAGNVDVFYIHSDHLNSPRGSCGRERKRS
jgi:hypothetical protein